MFHSGITQARFSPLAVFPHMKERTILGFGTSPRCTILRSVTAETPRSCAALLQPRTFAEP